MRFAFTDDHDAMRAVVRDLLQRRWSAALTRTAWEAEPGNLDRGIWAELTDLGAMHVLVPEPDGGLGMDYLALVGVLEEAGRVALPHPVVESAAVAAPLLVGHGNDASGAGAMVGASWRGGPVPCGLDVERVLVVGDDELRLHERAELELTALDTVDGGRRLARIDRSRGGVILSDDPVEVAAAFDRAALGVAATLLGLADTMLSMTVTYVSERTQFGVPVGSFQAVKHHLADALMQLSFARPAVYQASHSLARSEPDASRDVSRARVLADEAAAAVGRHALQCHGAIGYTVEHDLHLYLKRSWALSRSWGGKDWHTERVATALGI